MRFVRSFSISCQMCAWLEVVVVEAERESSVSTHGRWSVFAVVAADSLLS